MAETLLIRREMAGGTQYQVQEPQYNGDGMEGGALARVCHDPVRTNGMGAAQPR